MTPGEMAWKLGFQQSPIILVGGVAASFLGGYLPIMAITEIINFPAGLLSGGSIGTDNFFANFRPLPGSSIIAQEIGKYPFANQTVAANSVIVQPLSVSMEMQVISRTRLGYYEKLAIMLALQKTLYTHNTTGGRYHVLTPSYIYMNCLMRSMTDISNAATKQPQNTWQLDFEKPLVTLDEAAAAQNSLMSYISSETKMPSVDWSGVDSSTGIPNSLSSPAGSPLSSGVSGTGLGSDPLVQSAFNAPSTPAGVGTGAGQVTLPGAAGGPLSGGGV